MNNSLTRFLLLVSSIFIFLFEMVEMFPASDDAIFSSTFIIAIPTVLFLSYLILYFQRNRIIKREGYLVAFTALVIGIYISSLLCGGLTSAFQTNVQYITVILPVLVLWGTNGQSEQNYDYTIKCICIVFIGLALYYFSNYSLHVFEELESQNNGAYTLLYFLPFILCLRKGYLRIVGIIVVLAALLFSLKRGGLLAFALAILIYWAINTFSYSGKKFGFWNFVLSALVVVAFVYFYIYFDQMTGNLLSTRFQSLQDDGGSGRLDTYPVVWSHIKESSIINLIFGHGWNAVWMQCGMKRSAHNDFLEILYDFGIIVFTVYILFYIKFFKVVRQLIRRRSFYAAPLSATFVLFFANSMVSHIIYYPKYVIIFSLFLGLMSNRINQEIR